MTLGASHGRTKPELTNSSLIITCAVEVLSTAADGTCKTVSMTTVGTHGVNLGRTQPEINQGCINFSKYANLLKKNKM